MKIQEKCWRGKFLDNPCPKPAMWRSPDRLCVGLGAPFMAAVRWCDDHRHPEDVPLDPRAVVVEEAEGDS